MSKQFNIKGINGLYLSNEPQEQVKSFNFRSLLIEDYSLFPTSLSQANLYSFKNARYEDYAKLVGSNSLQKSNSTVKYSEIMVNDVLIPNKMYYNTFKFYFRFYGSTLKDFVLSGQSNSTNTKKILDRLRVKIYVTIGSNQIPLNLTSLEKFNGFTWVPVTNANDVTGAGSISGGNYGIQIATGLNSEKCIDMAYTGTTMVNNLFNAYKDAPLGYNFRVNAAFPGFDKLAKKTKTYKITVKYLNIGVSGVNAPYNTSESVELMANSFVFYQLAQNPTELAELYEETPSST